MMRELRDVLHTVVLVVGGFRNVVFLTIVAAFLGYSIGYVQEPSTLGYELPDWLYELTELYRFEIYHLRKHEAGLLGASFGVVVVLLIATICRLTSLLSGASEGE